MDRVELAELANDLLEAHRSTLIIDPFFRISLEVVEGDFHSNCSEDASSSLSWVIKLNPEKHQDVYDIQYSIVESLLGIIMAPLNGSEKSGVVARLATSICNIFAEDDEDEEEADD